MSSAYKCDRCGEFDTYGEVTVEGSIIQFDTFKRTYSREKNFPHGRDYPSGGKLELCKECAEPIKKFLFNWWWNNE